ncbi:MAG: cytochrome c [Bacteroidota bacterium]
MKIHQQSILGILCLLFLAGTYSCQQAGGESTGSEFIPDMAHSVAYEANVYTDYSLNAWEEESVVSRRELTKPRLPVSGTIPRGFSGAATNDGTYQTAAEAVANTMQKMKTNTGIAYTPNGSVPYYYPDTEEGRLLATDQIKYNPFPITKAGIAQGQELYGYYCGICHGDKGDGGGYLVRDNGGKYPAQPANFLLEEFLNASNGRYYHSIMYGKNAMGAYADKLSYEERWNVIHYIRLLQAKELKVKYDSETNELNPDFGVPQSMVHIEEMHEEDHGPENGEDGYGHEDESHDEEGSH